MAILHLGRRRMSSKATISWLLGPGSSTVHLETGYQRLLTDLPRCSGGVSAVPSSPGHFLICQKLSNSNLHALLGSCPSSTRALCNGLFEFLGLCDYFLDLTATFHAIFHGLWIQWHCKWNIRYSLFQGLSKPLEMTGGFELSFFKIYGHPPPKKNGFWTSALRQIPFLHVEFQEQWQIRNSCQSRWSI